MRMINIYDYSNYRRFLSDMLAQRKRSGQKESFRAMARAVGLNVSTVTRIIKAERNLQPAMVEKFARYLGLTKKKK